MNGRIASLLAFVASATSIGSDVALHAADIVPLGPEFVLTSDTSYVQKQPWVGCDDSGRFVICYAKGDMFARIFDRDGVPLTNDFLLNPTIEHGEQDEGYVAVDPTTGDFFIGWSDRHGNDTFQMGCGGRFFRYDGVPYGPEQILNTHTEFSQFEPHAAFMPGGPVLTAWSDAGTDGSVGCVGRLYDRFGNPLTQDVLLNVPHAGTQIDPSVSCSRNGLFAVAFVDASGQSGPPREIMVRLFDSALNPLTGNILVNSSSAGMQRDAIVAMDADGDFVVIWQDESGTDGSGWGVFARLFDPTGTPKGPQFVVSQQTQGDQRDPHVTMDYAGNFVCTWESNATGDFDVMIRRFDRHGNPLSGDIRVHENTGGDQTLPKSCLSHNGQRLITVWFDSNSDDYGRVFALPTIVPDAPAQVGKTTTLSLDLPGMGGELYLLLPSLSQNPGIAVNGGRTLALTPDALFLFALAYPNSLLLDGVFGQLDASGKAQAHLKLPFNPAASGITLHFAALTLAAGTTSEVEYFTDTLELPIQ